MTLQEIFDFYRSYSMHGSDNTNLYAERNNSKKFNVDLKIEDYVAKKIQEKSIIIITGDAGDGKSALLNKLQDKKLLDQWTVFNDLSECSNSQEVVWLIKCILDDSSSEKIYLNANSGKLIESFIKDGKIAEYKNLKTSPKTCVINFDKRNFAFKDAEESVENTEFYAIIDKFILSCEEMNVNVKENNFLYNLIKLREPKIIERLRIIFNCLYMTGAHLSLRELLACLSALVIGKANTIDDVKPYYDNLFDETNEYFVKLDILNKDGKKDGCRKDYFEHSGSSGEFVLISEWLPLEYMVDYINVINKLISEKILIDKDIEYIKTGIIKLTNIQGKEKTTRIETNILSTDTNYKLLITDVDDKFNACCISPFIDKGKYFSDEGEKIIDTFPGQCFNSFEYYLDDQESHIEALPCIKIDYNIFVEIMDALNDIYRIDRYINSDQVFPEYKKQIQHLYKDEKSTKFVSKGKVITIKTTEIKRRGMDSGNLKYLVGIHYE